LNIQVCEHSHGSWSALPSIEMQLVNSVSLSTQVEDLFRIKQN